MTERSRTEPGGIPPESREKSAVAEAVGQPFGELRQLLDRLPSPIPPRIIEARAGMVSPGLAENSGVPLPLVGDPPGSIPPGAVGGVPTVVSNMRSNNLLVDPLFDSLFQISQPVSTETVLGRGLTRSGYGIATAADVDAWFGLRISGSSLVQMASGPVRLNPGNPFRSANLQMSFLSASGMTEGRLRSRTVDLDDFGISATFPNLQYLLVSIGVWRQMATAGTQTLILQLWDETSGVVRSSTTFDLGSLPIGETERISAAYVPSAAERLHSYQLRVRIQVTNPTGSGCIYQLGEPMMLLTDSIGTPNYTPDVGNYVPKILVHPGGFDDFDRFIQANDRQLQHGYSVNVDGTTKWGDETDHGAGEPWDTRLRRPDGVPHTLEVDDNNDGADPSRLWVGADYVRTLASSLAITYGGPNGEPTQVDRTGAMGAATTTITYDTPTGHVTEVEVVRGGKTVTIVPTYSGDQITSLARTVA